jgi:hypothetical protein
MPSIKPSYRGYVYLIGSKRFGWYKIGKTRTPTIRIQDIGILLPFRIETFAVWKTVDHDLLESSLHDLYRAYWINGEWFSFDADELSKLMESEMPILSECIPDNKMFQCNNIEDDAISKFCLTKANAVTEESKQLSSAFMKAVHAYLEENGMEKTKENKKIAREVVWRSFQSERDKLKDIVSKRQMCYTLQ